MARRRWSLSFFAQYHLMGWLRVLTKGGRRRFSQDLADGALPPLWLLIYTLIAIVSIKVAKEIRRFWRRLRNGRYDLDPGNIARQ